MYDVQLFATSSADWAQSVELIDAATNLPLEGADEASYELAVEDRRGRRVLHRSTEAGTITTPAPNIIQWRFLPNELAGLCDGTTYRIGLTMQTPAGTIQLLIGSLAFIDGIVAP